MVRLITWLACEFGPASRSCVLIGISGLIAAEYGDCISFHTSVYKVSGDAWVFNFFAAGRRGSGAGSQLDISR
jgi:hypothetical protein